MKQYTKQLLRTQLRKRAMNAIARYNETGVKAYNASPFDTPSSSGYENRLLKEIRKELIKENERYVKAGIEPFAEYDVMVEVIDARLARF